MRWRGSSGFLTSYQQTANAGFRYQKCAEEALVLYRSPGDDERDQMMMKPQLACGTSTRTFHSRGPSTQLNYRMNPALSSCVVRRICWIFIVWWMNLLKYQPSQTLVQQNSRELLTHFVCMFLLFGQSPDSSEGLIIVESASKLLNTAADY